MPKTIITTNDVAKVAKLANLTLTDSEIDKFTPQLGQIFGYIDQLSEINTDQVNPTVHVNNLRNIVHEDAVDKDRLLTKKEATNQSSKIEKNMFIVKAVIDNS